MEFFITHFNNKIFSRSCSTGLRYDQTFKGSKGLGTYQDTLETDKMQDQLQSNSTVSSKNNMHIKKWVRLCVIKSISKL